MSREHGSRRLPPNRGGAVVKHCRKYTMGHDVGRGDRPGHCPWSRGDRAGVLPTLVGGVVVTVGRTVLQMWRSVGPVGQDPAYSSGGGARGGPGPPGRSAVVHTRRSGRHVEVPDPSRGEVRAPGCE